MTTIKPQTPQSLDKFKPKGIGFVFTDIDDTLTEEEKLHDDAYSALWDLARAGIKVIPVTGRPAGWCEMILRTWPVEAVIGENGGFYFSFKKEAHHKKVHREFLTSPEKQKENRKKLETIGAEVLKKIPGSRLASDQFCRLMDLAIDFKEDGPELSKKEILQIVDVFKTHGAQAKISSIHVNGWFGDYNKSKMIQHFFKTHLKKDFKDLNDLCVFIGDSPNDEESFKLFNNSVAVKNIQDFLKSMKHPPKFITKALGGKGFVELAKKIRPVSQKDPKKQKIK